MLKINLFVVIVVILTSAYGQDEDNPEEEKKIKIGALFERDDEDSKMAFLNAIEMVNGQDTVIKLEGIVAEVDPYDSFQVGKEVCTLMEGGVAAIFGPQSRFTWTHVQSQCDNKEIPQVASNPWDPQINPGSCLINLYPHPQTLSRAIVDLVQAWHWKGFTIAYDDLNSVKRIGNLLKMADEKGYVVTVRQITGEDGNYRKVLQNIKFSGEKNIVFEISPDILEQVLLQAQQVGLIGSDYSYIITSLDLQYIDLEPFKWSGTNITGIRLIKPTTDYFKKVVTPWYEEAKEEKGDEEDDYDETERKRRQEEDDDALIEEEEKEEDEEKNDEENEEEEVETPIKIPKTLTALIHDGVLLFSNAIENLELEIEPKGLSCDDNRAWELGYSIRNYIKMSEYEGLSGLIKFDYEGFRSDVELEVIELTEEGLKVKGTWNLTSGLQVRYPEGGSGPWAVDEDLRNMTFIVEIALTSPYGMLKQDSKKLTGNDRFEGFGVDLIHELSIMSGFNYTFIVREDKSSGNPQGNGKWSGMIGDVLDGKAHLAIADMTISRERERDADFTMPFMNLGISILYKKPRKAPPSTFSFLSPFSAEVWAYMLSAYFGVSLLLFFIGRISPYEWTNKYPCIEEPTELENQFTLLNSYWFTIGSLMQQGSDIAPIAVSTRMIAAIWWFFTLIMVSSYTANLAAFLTVEATVAQFTNVEGLANHKTIKYGAKANGTTANFFRDSELTLYQKMWDYMSKNPDVMMGTNELGVQRVLDNDDYAFLMESTSIEYEVERKCDLFQVGGLLDNKGYGIVMKQNSSYRNVLSRNVVQLQERGKLTQLKNKWWKEKRGGGACAVKSEGGAAEELGLANVGGVFLVLLGGCIVAIFIALAELAWDIYKRDDKVSFREELKEEIRFITKCHGTTKPVKKGEEKSEESDSFSKGTETDLALD